MPWVGLTWTSLILTAYLIGRLPTSYLAARLLAGQDIRQLGDGNAGATNVFRTVGSKAGIAVGIIDVGKGAVAVLLVRGIIDSTAAEMVAGVVVVAGHNWPVYLQLRGGRGAATAVGVLLAMLPAVAIPVSLSGLVVLYIIKSATKVLGLAFISIVFLAVWPFGYDYPHVAYSVGIPVLVGASHYLSLRRVTPSEGRSGEQDLPQE